MLASLALALFLVQMRVRPDQASIAIISRVLSIGRSHGYPWGMEMKTSASATTFTTPSSVMPLPFGGSPLARSRSLSTTPQLSTRAETHAAAHTHARAQEDVPAAPPIGEVIAQGAGFFIWVRTHAHTPTRARTLAQAPGLGARSCWPAAPRSRHRRRRSPTRTTVNDGLPSAH